MRVAFISDVHSNLPALEAVIADARLQKVNHLICLGDIVGYGPQPVETIQRLREVASAVIMGNHDAAACGLLNPTDFNPFARETAERAVLTLQEPERKWLRSLPYILEGGDFIGVHGSLESPEQFAYLDTKADAMVSFTRHPEVKLLVVGHTHNAGAFVQNGDNGPALRVEPSEEGLTLKPGMRCILNPGSVGFPRSENIVATYAIYDTDKRHITFCEVEYDLAAYRLAVVRNGYNVAHYWFLNPKGRGVIHFERAFQKSKGLEEDLPAVITGHGFQTKPRRGIPASFLLTIVVMCCLALGAVIVLYVTDRAHDDIVASAHVQSANLLPPINTWSFAGERDCVEPHAALSNSMTITPAYLRTREEDDDEPNVAPEPVRVTLTSPPCVLPRGTEHLRLTFRAGVIGSRSASSLRYAVRPVFIMKDGTQRRASPHRYKRADFQGFSINVFPGAVSVRITFDVETPQRIDLVNPILRTF